MYKVLSDATLPDVLRRLRRLRWTAVPEKADATAAAQPSTSSSFSVTTATAGANAANNSSSGGGRGGGGGGGGPVPGPSHEPFVLKATFKVLKGQFGHMALVAQLAAGLAKHHPGFGVNLVDLLLEDIRAGLDSPGEPAYQRRVAQMRFLGELYNYALVKTDVIFDTLYLLISHGRGSPEDMQK
jgi:hypothetical protein